MSLSSNIMGRTMACNFVWAYVCYEEIIQCVPNLAERHQAKRTLLRKVL